MPRAIFTVVCRKASVEAQTNVLNIFEVLEELTLPPLPPGVHLDPVAPLALPLTIVTLWERAEAAKGEKFESRFRLLGPNGTQLGEGSFNVDLTGHLRARTIAQMTAFPYVGPGVYRVITEFRGVEATWSAVGDFPILFIGPTTEMTASTAGPPTAAPTPDR